VKKDILESNNYLGNRAHSCSQAMSATFSLQSSFTIYVCYIFLCNPPSPFTHVTFSLQFLVHKRWMLHFSLSSLFINDGCYIFFVILVHNCWMIRFLLSFLFTSDGCYVFFVILLHSCWILHFLCHPCSQLLDVTFSSVVLVHKRWMLRFLCHPSSQLLDVTFCLSSFFTVVGCYVFF
jgi:hypothetical protein